MDLSKCVKPVVVLSVISTGKVWAQNELYALLDTDRNGEISESEASVLPGLRSKWTQLDANRDGVVDMSEFARLEFSSGPAGTELEASPPQVPAL